MSVKEKTSYGLSSECKDLIEELVLKLGISRAAVIEMAVRKLYDAEMKG